MEAAALKKLHPELFQRRFMEQETRPDGRSFHESRSVTVAMHAVSTADGSCVSKVGDTSVAAGIQLVSYEPMEGTETKGDFSEWFVGVGVPPLFHGHCCFPVCRSPQCVPVPIGALQNQENP